MEDYLKYFKTFPDFPKPGVLFYDLSTLLADAKLFQMLVHDLEEKVKKYEFDIVAGVDARGFIFASILALRFSKGLMMMRKSGKLPGVVTEINYGLEYGKNTLAIQNNILKLEQKVLIIDDVLATAGTAKAATQLVEALGAKVSAIAFVLELSALKGRKLIQNYPIEVLATV